MIGQINYYSDKFNGTFGVTRAAVFMQNWSTFKPLLGVTVKHRKCGICCSGVFHTSVLPCVPGQMSKFHQPFGNSLHSDENNQSAPVYSALVSKANALSEAAVKTPSLSSISQASF